MASEECALGCGNPLNPHDIGVWKEVTGFVGGPGKDSMRLRADTGRHAHNSCVEKKNSGQAVTQPSLLDDTLPLPYQYHLDHHLVAGVWAFPHNCVHCADAEVQ